jgi:hypothetical protein
MVGKPEQFPPASFMNSNSPLFATRSLRSSVYLLPRLYDLRGRTCFVFDVMLKHTTHLLLTVLRLYLQLRCFC